MAGDNIGDPGETEIRRILSYHNCSHDADWTAYQLRPNIEYPQSSFTAHLPLTADGRQIVKRQQPKVAKAAQTQQRILRRW